VNEHFMRNLVGLSFLEEGPRLAQEFLAKNGIQLVIEPHLPKTHVDGAAIMLQDGTPVIGLSLRYDRLDNFWFSLSHELAHIALHLDHDNTAWFADNLDIKHASKEEDDADAWAQGHLIPAELLERVLDCEIADDVEVIAQEFGISPSIIAGRKRFQEKNWKLFSRLVGQGEPSRILIERR
jgi:HTH-type transcriptional regulator/antitoxin HigA